jgi:nucleotide-binding universal stress UspA family protein
VWSVVISYYDIYAEWRRAKEGVMFRRAVVPLDGTPGAEAALPYAAALARRFDTRLVLVRVVVGAARRIAQLMSPYGANAPPVALDLVVEAARTEQLQAVAYLDEQARLLRAQDLTVLTVVADASPVAALRAVATREPDTVVVMAGRTGGWFARLFLGAPNPERLRRIGVAVLVVPGDGLHDRPARATLPAPWNGPEIHLRPIHGPAW